MPLLRRKMGEDTTYASTYSALKQSFAERRTAEPADQPPAAPVEDRLCPGMFKGLSAVQLPGNLFEPVDTLIASHHVQQRNAEPEVNRAARRGARPLWCLVGTFKTSLTSVVQVDYAQDSLHWSQRNPRGGYQPIRVPLSQIEQVFVTRVTQSDEDIEEKQFMVVVRTSTRPSQVVFGFSGLGEANQFKKFFEK
ncbi:hypothetical protein AGDE_12018 [Angomonas deanei]|uniref:PH-like domain-containing protein n=1 Tax=Angomonas deanei TaxID=59799 RepID=A0A7G2CM33_9TRYP|nr:hypothetical protein AGDE_12018 [Angomonas deanei]CAD2220117.1 hypothetical protein, conserved [Angomonas deanei]|eukprot:EPY25104.1 hypothetical protein AGDE_12018 [Angomonas deanei]